METQTSIDEIFIIPPPPTTTVLLTDDFLTSFITPPPPRQFRDSNKKFSSSSKHSENDADSDYHSVGENGPVTPDTVKRSHDGHVTRSSPLGASPPKVIDESHTKPTLPNDERYIKTTLPNDERYIKTTLPNDEVTVRPDNASGASYHTNNTNYHTTVVSQRNVLAKQYTAEYSDNNSDSSSIKSDLRHNRMYSSLQRPSAVAAHHRKQLRNRRGSMDELDTRPQSPRDEKSILGNFGFERGNEYRQAVNPEVHGAVEHFIRSERRYISDINSLLNMHVDHLLYQGCLNIDVVNSLKSSLLRLLHFHQRTCGDLEICFTKFISQTSDGSAPDYFAMINYAVDILMDSRGGFKTYINFCVSRAQLIRSIGQMDADETARWEKYLDQCNPSGDPAHSLEAGLAMPVQRISDYPAMLSEIQHLGGIRSGVLAEKLGRARVMLEGVSKAVDERLKMQQEFSILYVNNRTLEVLIGPIEELLQYGSVVEVKSRDIDSIVPDSDTGLYLLIYKKGVALVQKMKLKKKHSFNKLLSGMSPATKSEYVLKKFYPVSCLQVRDLPNKHVFELTDTVNQQRLVLASRLINAKAELIKGIADIIQDYDKFLSSSLQMKDAV